MAEGIEQFRHSYPSRRYDEAKHPRLPKGDIGGGRYASKLGTSSASIKPVDAATFHRGIAEAKKGPKGPYVSIYSPEEYGSMRTFMNADHTVGGALHDHGDGRIEITSLFNNGGPPGSGADMLEFLIGKGGNYLECFGEVLPRIYATRGFVVEETFPFDDHQAPADWSYETEGRPDYHTMRRRTDG